MHSSRDVAIGGNRGGHIAAIGSRSKSLLSRTPEKAFLFAVTMVSSTYSHSDNRLPKDGSLVVSQPTRTWGSVRCTEGAMLRLTNQIPSLQTL